MRSPASKRELYFLACLLLGCATLSLPARAEVLSEPGSGITVTVVRDGSYTIQSAKPHWTFAGTVSGGVENIVQNSGRDHAGDFREIAFDGKSAPALHFSIRTWTGRAGVLLTQTVQEGCDNPPPFPSFSTYPQFPYQMSFGGTWCPARYDLSGKEGPWVFFNDAAETAILSPAANFMVAKLSVGANATLDSGIDDAIATLPQSFSHSTLLVFDRGINHTFDTWGHLLTDVQGKVRPANDSDTILKYIGYWTDNGSAYYYNYDSSKGYEGTLLAVRDDFRSNGVPLGYVQLDSWWYRKGESGDWNPQPDQWNFGINTYVAHPDLFPDGLASFRERLGVPLVTHARWIDVKSPYRSKYKISNNVAIDPRYWSDIAAYLKDSGVATYEQDWLDSRATANFNLNDQAAFMDDMAQALAANGITMQYCMPTPRHLLQGSKYSNLTTVRVSNDHFERSFWPQVMYASRLASSIGAWPWVDVFASNEAANLMLATLSAGVVGASDAIGDADVRNLRRAARADGVLVKPDAPLVPSDTTYLNEAQNGPGPIVAFSYSDHANGRAAYVVAFKRSGVTQATFTPAEAGLTGSVFAYDVRNQSGTRTDAHTPIALDLSDDWSYVVAVPVSRGGVAIVGDLGKFAPRGKTRIASIVDRDTSTDVTVSFAAGEKSVTLTGYSEFPPANLSWSPDTHLFTAIVTPGADNTGQITITPVTPRHRPAGK
jgi:hypothetical protein